MARAGLLQLPIVLFHRFGVERSVVLALVTDRTAFGLGDL